MLLNGFFFSFFFLGFILSTVKLDYFHVSLKGVLGRVRVYLSLQILILPSFYLLEISATSFCTGLLIAMDFME